MKKIGIIGKGGQAREIEGYCQDDNIEVAFYALDPQYMKEGATDEIDLNAPSEEQRNTPVILALGAPAIKRALAETWPGDQFATLISPRAYTTRTSKVGEGTVIAPLGSIGPNSVVGKHTLINIASSVAHDCNVGDFSTISPGARIGGNVKIGDGCFIGIGATIKNGVSLASGCVVGAGAVVLHDVETPNSVVVGVPAKTVKVNEGWMRDI